MAPYTIHEDFDATTFTVNPEPFDVGGIGILFFQGLLCLGLMTGCTKVVLNTSYDLKDVAWLSWCVLLGVCLLAFYIPYRRVRRLRRENEAERAQVSIHAGETDLRVGDAGDGQLIIDYGKLHRLVVGNSLDGEYVGGSTGQFVAVGGTGLVGGAAMATTAMLGGAANMAARAHALRLKKYALVCFQLKAEAGGVSHKLAGGMTEAAANGLMQDLSKAIQERRGL